MPSPFFFFFFQVIYVVLIPFFSLSLFFFFATFFAFTIPHKGNFHFFTYLLTYLVLPRDILLVFWVIPPLPSFLHFQFSQTLIYQTFLKSCIIIIKKYAGFVVKKKYFYYDREIFDIESDILQVATARLDSTPPPSPNLTFFKVKFSWPT